MAAYYSEQIIQEVLSQTDLVSLIQEYLPLKPNGQNFKGLCPFHQEKTPSFVVSPVKQIYHCFGCGAGGNAARFLMQISSIPFPEAIENLAAKAGLTLKEENESNNLKHSSSKKNRALKLYSYAHWFYQNQIKKPLAKPVLDYLINQRGFDQKTLAHFQVGYAPNQWDGLVSFLKERKAPLELAQELGLVRKSSKGNWIDFFRDRIIFPITNRQNKVIAFGGRVFSETKDAPKYINSPESLIYHKSNELFGWGQNAKELFKTKRVFLVEGYTDVMRLSQHGFHVAIAPLGTSLTNSQIKLLSRQVSEWILIFDGDAAGQKALNRAIDIFLDQGLNPHVLHLPNNLDPDDYLQKYGTQSFNDLLKNKKNALDHLILTQKEKGESAYQNSQSAKIIWQKILQLGDPDASSYYASQLASHLGYQVQHEAILGQNRNRTHNLDQRNASLNRDFSVERTVFGLFLKHKSIAGGVFKQLFGPDAEINFTDPDLSKIYKTLADKNWQEETQLDFEKLDTNLNEKQRKLALEMMLGDRLEVPVEPKQKEQFIKQCLVQFKNNMQKKKLKEITQAIQTAQHANDKLKTNELIRQKQELLNDLKSKN